MAIHIDFIRDKKQNYTFFDRHTDKEIAMGGYCKDGFQLIQQDVSYTKMFPSAAVAWTWLNRLLTDTYGW